jgi:hypothetical protein
VGRGKRKCLGEQLVRTDAGGVVVADREHDELVHAVALGQLLELDADLHRRPDHEPPLGVARPLERAVAELGERLRGDGAPVGPRLRITPNGVRTTQPAIASDGSSAAVVAWTVFRSRTGGPIQARRLAPGGIASGVRTVSHGPVISGFSPVLAGAGGRVAAAWVQGDDVRYSVFR